MDLTHYKQLLQDSRLETEEVKRALEDKEAEFEEYARSAIEALDRTMGEAYKAMDDIVGRANLAIRSAISDRKRSTMKVEAVTRRVQELEDQLASKDYQISMMEASLTTKSAELRLKTRMLEDLERAPDNTALLENRTPPESPQRYLVVTSAAKTNHKPQGGLLVVLTPSTEVRRGSRGFVFVRQL